MPSTKKPKNDNGDDDDDDDKMKPQYMVCPKCGYSVKIKGKVEEKEILCEKCGARMVKSMKKGKVSMKDMVDDIADVCRKIRGE